MLRFAHPDHEANQIGNRLVEFGRHHRARDRQFQLVRFVIHHLLALQAVQDMRHADILKHGVVPARRTVRVTIERTQIGVEPVRAGTGISGFATSPGNDAQIRRSGTEPQLLLVGTRRYTHQFTDLVGREHQVFLDLPLG